MESRDGRRWLWPALFLGAFALGALLWALWMWQFVKKERAIKRDAITAPQRGDSAAGPAISNATATIPTNSK